MAPKNKRYAMKKKLKVFILFFLLSITPFIRGCGESFGFPFPALIDVLQFKSTTSDAASIPETVTAIIDSLKSPETLILLAVNFLFACLFTLNILRTKKYPRWTSSFLNSLAINVTAVWIMLGLIFIDIKQPLIKKMAEFYGTCYGHYFSDVPSHIADALDKIISKLKYPPVVILRDALNSFNIETIDIMSRSWFITVTALLALVIYSIKKVREVFKGSSK